MRRMPMQWIIALSPQGVYGIEWWAFASRWMVFKTCRFGKGWMVTLGPLRVYRYLIATSGGSPKTGRENE